LDVFVRAGARITAGVFFSRFEDAFSLAIAVGLNFVAKIDNGSGSVADRCSAVVALADFCRSSSIPGVDDVDLAHLANDLVVESAVTVVTDSVVSQRRVEAGGERIPLRVGSVFEVSPWLAVVGLVRPRARSSLAVDILAVAPESVQSVSVHLSEKLVTLFKTLLALLITTFNDGGDDELSDNVGEVGDCASQWTDAAWCSSLSFESSAVLVNFWGDESIPVSAFVNGFLDHTADLLEHAQITSLVFDSVKFAVVVSLSEVIVAVELLFVILF